MATGKTVFIRANCSKMSNFDDIYKDELVKTDEENAKNES
jgi:hypothetical protein